ncbi:MAG: hypothetical protein H0V12_06375 [Chloroflexi bacterium]|nr:hypothetical protein [Chloroflexota bacterium]
MHAAQITVVLTMGRVASTAVYRTINRRIGGRVYHVHSIDPKGLAAQARAGPSTPRHVCEGLQAARALLDCRGHVRIVTLVRDPVARNLSAAFARVRRGRDPDQLSMFIDDRAATGAFWQNFDDQEPFAWFDAEFRDVLGIDVYQRTFPKGGHTRIVEGRYDILIMRQELADEVKSGQLARFFNIPAMPIELSNRKSRAGGELHSHYERFKATAALTPGYLEQVARSQYMRHFYPVDVEEYVNRWRAAGVCESPE